MPSETNLVVQTIGGLELPSGARVSPSGLTLPPNLPWEEYTKVGEHLRWMKHEVEAAHDTVLWLIGDYLQYGEHTYGEKFAQAEEVFGRSESRLANVQWVARSIPPERRRPALSFRHHEEVASLDPSEQDELLRRAEEEGLTSDDLRTERKKAKGQARDDADRALDRAASAVAALPTGEWAGKIMAALVRPLKHEARPTAYWNFLNKLYVAVGKWRDRQ